MSDEVAKPDVSAAPPAESALPTPARTAAQAPAAKTPPEPAVPVAAEPPASSAPAAAALNPESLLTVPPPLAAVPTPLPSVTLPRAIDRLIKIEIDNYRAFRGHFDLDLPEGCNLLVYGENGAGKSSLFNSVCDFLESPNRVFFDEKLNRSRPLKHDDYRHRYNTDPAVVRLTFSAPASGGEGILPDKIYEWSKTKNDALDPEMRSVDKAKGFLDYKSLLRVHLLPSGEREINLFDLFINPLLAHYKNPVSSPSLTFADEWKKITDAFKPYVWKPADLDIWFRDFNAGFERVVNNTVAKASELLSSFDKELAVSVVYTRASYKWGPKRLTPPKIIVKPSFRRQQHDDYDRFLNEARLSALAIAIYFAGLKESPATGLRLLVLDDILIGLDMANRMAVLEIAEKLFRDWQVVILTYHKAWFEILKARTGDGDWLHPWRCVNVRTRRAMGTEFPIVVADSGTLLAQAHRHFDSGDTRAAAVYARSAWESVLSWYCAEMHLPVGYAESRRELDTNDFLTSIEKQLLTIRDRNDREYSRAIIREIKHARHFVLNPHSHYNPELENEIGAEINAGIGAVEDFDLLLRCLKWRDFAEPGEELERFNVGELIAASLSQLDAGRKAAALDTLSRAFTLHLDEWFRIRGELLPYGVNPTTERLFALSGQRDLFAPATWTRLKHSKDYLLGKVHVKKLEVDAFGIAARLLLRLRFHFLLSRHVADLAPP